jgi:glycerol-3-phosphate cytidylyltransferase
MKGIIAGNFDVLHPGYIHMFREAKAHCDHLTIALHNDPSYERPEKLPPILSLNDRKMMLLSIRHIDEVIEYDTEADLYAIMKHHMFDIRILGDDYIGKYATGQEYCGKIVYMDRSHGWSTTKFKKAIAASLSDR